MQRKFSFLRPPPWLFARQFHDWPGTEIKKSQSGGSTGPDRPRLVVGIGRPDAL